MNTNWYFREINQDFKLDRNTWDLKQRNASHSIETIFKLISVDKTAQKLGADVRQNTVKKKNTVSWESQRAEVKKEIKSICLCSH